MNHLSQNGKILVVIQLLRLIFGIYLVVTDIVRYNDPGSAMTVFVIYLVLAIFTWLFRNGNKTGLPGILTVSVLLIIFNTIFTIMALGDSVEAGLHSPTNNIIPTILRYVFFLATLLYSILVIRENRKRV